MAATLKTDHASTERTMRVTLRTRGRARRRGLGGGGTTTTAGAGRTSVSVRPLLAGRESRQRRRDRDRCGPRGRRSVEGGCRRSRSRRGGGRRGRHDRGGLGGVQPTTRKNANRARRGTRSGPIRAGAVLGRGGARQQRIDRGGGRAVGRVWPGFGRGTFGHEERTLASGPLAPGACSRLLDGRSAVARDRIGQIDTWGFLGPQIARGLVGGRVDPGDVVVPDAVP